MKKHFIFTLFVISFSFVYAQDYMPIRTNDTTSYLDTENYMWGLRIDSSSVVSNNTVFHLNRSWNTDDYRCNKPDGPSVMGKSFVKVSDSLYYFFNKNSDTILIEPLTALDSSWLFYQFIDEHLVNVLFYAKVTNVAYEEFLGIKDTVKHFVINAYQTNGQNYNHSLNGTEFIISKNYGFVKLFDFYEFPISIMVMNLCGSVLNKAGFTSISWWDINDKNVGDEFHYEYSYNQPGYGSGNGKSIQKILTKNISQNSDLVTYTIQYKETSHTINYQNNVTDTTYIIEFNETFTN